jgi:hypothetical protein
MKEKKIQTGKKELKLCVFSYGNILQIENLKDSVKKLLELLNEFREVEGYKIVIRKSWKEWLLKPLIIAFLERSGGLRFQANSDKQQDH